MTDSFKTFARSLTLPAENARAVELSDAEDLRASLGGFMWARRVTWLCAWPVAAS